MFGLGFLKVIKIQKHKNEKNIILVMLTFIILDNTQKMCTHYCLLIRL